MMKILIAEDDRELRQLFTHVLARHGYTVTGVSNGQEARTSSLLSRRIAGISVSRTGRSLKRIMKQSYLPRNGMPCRISLTGIRRSNHAAADMTMYSGD